MNPRKKSKINEKKLVDKYLQKETTVSGDIALPPDKASTKKKKTDDAEMVPVKKNKKLRKNKKQILHGGDA